MIYEPCEVIFLKNKPKEIVDGTALPTKKNRFLTSFLSVENKE